ncbi:MAG: hypothetical protein H6815_11710 [Phycisphaeraceae bacterium]|nr:hypothetical protein [Phycisphaerales bacterium]MCB9861105.1 hypothetical protein [Phycisphaeraceae bacterium]
MPNSVHFGWDHPVPLWVWPIALMICCGVSWWSYRGLSGRTLYRGMLSCVRAVLLFALLVLLAGPRMESPNERVETDQLIMLVDRSISMTIEDGPGVSFTRDEQLQQAATHTQQQLKEMQSNDTSRVVRWLGFGSGAFEIDAETSSESVALPSPTQLRTRIGASVSQALDIAAGQPLAGLVLFSDGKSADELSSELLQRLEADHVPVFVVPLGSAEAKFDLAIDDVTAPSLAYINDDVPVRVRLLQLGKNTREFVPGDTVRIIDDADGSVLAETELTSDMFTGDAERIADVNLVIQDSEVGRRSLRVEVRTASGDLSDANNSMDLPMEFVDEPIRVLFLDGGPRWDQRYVRELLNREQSIRSASLQLSTGKRYIREGDIEVTSLPSSPEEWAEFDVVIIGDVRPELFTEPQLINLRDAVASRGTGLLWMAGPSTTPHAWAQTPLADCLPIRIVDHGSSRAPRFPTDVVLRRTETAARLGLLDMADPVHPGTIDDPGWPARLSAPETGWSRLRWATLIQFEDVKPAAEVLAMAEPVGGTSADERPLVLIMRFGAGQVVYVGTDEIWRWRFGRGETLPERFWLPIIRSQARERLSSVGRGVTFRVAPSRSYVDQIVRLELGITDQRLLDLKHEKIAIEIQRQQSDEVEQVDLVPEDMGNSANARFAQTWVPRKPGRYTITVKEPSLSSYNLQVDIDVRNIDDELADPETNHQLLIDLAERTGGKVLDGNDMSALSQLPNRSRRIALAPDTEPLWDKWWVLTAFLGLLVIEWVGRKLISLV